jgi:hypothetical protein
MTKKHTKIINKWVLVSGLLFLLIGHCSCRIPIPNGLGKVKLEEMKELALEVPEHSSFKKVDEYSGAKEEQANIGWSYKSTATYEDVRQYYTEKLTEKNWNLVSEEKVSDWFSVNGGRKITFQKRDIILTIQYAEPSSNFGWEYSLDLHYGY